MSLFFLWWRDYQASELQAAHSSYDKAVSESPGGESGGPLREARVGGPLREVRAGSLREVRVGPLRKARGGPHFSHHPPPVLFVPAPSELLPIHICCPGVFAICL